MKIYFCADDFGLSPESDGHIKECKVNKISVLANFDADLSGLNAKVSTHINFVEGKCVSDKNLIPLLVDENGYFKHTFGGLLKLSLGKTGRAFRQQVKTEMRAQINKVNAPEMIDSHQHVHMIPAIFSCLCEIIKEDGLQTEYLRIPAEPVLPYISAPELYKSYFSLNFIKQQTLKFLNLFNKSKLKSMGLKQNDFFGIMFSGNMNEKRVNRLLNAFVRHAERKNRDLEVLFHPGFVETAEGKNAMKEYKFSTFYLADGRKKEFLAAKNIAKDEKCR